MNQIISMIESSVEDEESKAKELKEDKEYVSSREMGIKRSIEKLESDTVVSKLLENKLSNIEKERMDIDKKIEECNNEVNNILEQIEEAEAKNLDSAKVLNELESMGEDVGEAKNIASERMTVLQKCREQLGKITEKLGVAFMESKSVQINAKHGSGEHQKISNKEMEDKSAGDTEKDANQQKIEEYNKMIDESVIKHGEMLKRAHYMSKEEKDMEHAIYTENAQRVKEEFAQQGRGK